MEKQGDAAHLDFADETFDAAVSNLVFHEVYKQPDKLALVREALRVVKPGGVFVFLDIFYSRKVYGDLALFLDQLKGDVAILGNVGLIYGKK